TAPFYVIAAVWKRYRVREMLPMPAFAFLVYAPPVLILFQEYFWGRMGIFQAANNLDGIFNESMNGFQFHILARGGFYLLSSLHLALPFLALGAVLTARRRHVLIALALSLVPIPLWNHFLQANFTDSYLITVYPWLGLLASVGLGSAARRIGSLRLRAAVLASFFALYGTLSFTSWVDPIHRRSDELQSLAESLESRRSSSDRVFGSWGTAVRYNWYTTGTLRDGACDYYERTDRELLLRRLSEPGGVYVIDEVPLSTPLKRLVGANRESARRELDWWEDADLGVQLTPTDLANGSFRVWRARID